MVLVVHPFILINIDMQGAAEKSLNSSATTRDNLFAASCVKAMKSAERMAAWSSVAHVVSVSVSMACTAQTRTPVSVKVESAPG